MFKKIVVFVFSFFVFAGLCIASTPNTYIAFIGGFNAPGYIAITPNGKYAYVSDSGSNSVLVIDTNPSSPTFNQLISAPGLVGVFNSPLKLAATPNSQYVYVINSLSNNIKVINTSSNTVVDTITGLIFPTSIAIAPNGLYAYVIDSATDSVRVIDLTTNTLLTTSALDGILANGSAIAITPNSNYAYITNLNGSVKVIDTNPLSPTFNQPVAAPGLTTVNASPQALAITANGLFAYVTDRFGTDVTVLDLTTNTVVTAPNLNAAFNQPNGVATTADGNYAYVTNFLGATGTISSVSVIDTNPSSPTYNSTLSTPGLVVPNPPPATRFKSLAATPDARFVYAVDDENNTVDVIYTGILTPPLNFKACMQHNVFLLQTDFINHLTWSAPVIGNPPAAYRIYRGANLQNFVAIVPATGPLEYDDHNRSPFVQDIYYIVSVDSLGNMSPSAASTTSTAPCF